MKKIIILILASLALCIDDNRTFILKNGDKVTGKLISEDYNSYVINTAFGELKINKSDIKSDKIFIKLKNGDNISGIVIDESETDFNIKTNFGNLKILKAEIDIVNFINQDSVSNPNEYNNDNRFYYADEQLIDVWFDPVGFTLSENSLYFSGLSWAYGITDKVQMSSNWISYLWGDLNFRPKIMIYKSGDVNKTQAASVGFHYHLRGSPSKMVYITDVDTTWRYVNELDGNNDNSDASWGEIFVAFTQSNLKKTGQGRINYTAGVSITYYENFEMPRYYIAVDIDAKKNLKLMAEIAYDEYYAPWYNRMNNMDARPIHFDFGFMYTPPHKDNLRIGIHYQGPWIAFYYKF